VEKRFSWKRVIRSWSETGEVTQDQNDFHVGFMHFLAHHLEKRGLYTEVKLVDQGTVDENMELNIHWE